MLHTRCILMDLTITSLTTSRTDRGITQDVLRRTAADADAGRWVSRLWTKAALDPISKHDAATRKLHQGMTLPWLDNSKRILPSAKVEEYMDLMRQRRPEREKLVAEHFLARFDHWLGEARAMRGTAFDAAEYPSAAEAACSFGFKVQGEPVPHRDDFRVTLAAPDMADLHAGLEDRLAAAARIARNDLISRITEPLVKMVGRLSDPEATFRDSLVDNIRAIAAAIPALNVTEDAGIEAVRQRLLSSLCRLDPEILRDSASDRSRAASQANAILAVMAPWLEDQPAAA